MLKRILFAVMMFCGVASAADIKTLGIVVRFSDGAMSASKINDMQKSMFGDGLSLASFWREASYGQINVVGDVYPEVVVSTRTRTSNWCGGNVVNEAKGILRARGFPVDSYQAFVVVHSNGAGCQNLGGGGMAIVNGSFGEFVLTHEFGHGALYLPHSSSIVCAPGKRCVVTQYGNPVDIMAKSWGNLNVVMKARKGWLGGTTADPSPERVYTHTAAPGVPVEYTIKRLTSSTGRVSVRMKTAAQIPSYLWIEYRALVGVDGVAKNTNWLFARGALLYLSGMTLSGVSCNNCIVDTQPTVSGLSDAAILPGQSYEFEGYRIETLAVTDDELTVRVTQL